MLLTLDKIKRFDDLYMRIAIEVGKMSRDTKHKVGAVIVKDDNILSYGYNGTPRGSSNETRDKEGNTRWTVVHAETNAICKLAMSTNSSIGSTLYTTISPCKECCRYVVQAGIKRLVYGDIYDKTALSFLKHYLEIHKYERD
tara:strand:- start:161 stop:586 length:426 start_codon:yes stop_codon:yes gene_type:complete